jgi:hypothetical protein
MLKTTNRITIHIHEIKDHKWFTHQIENGNEWKSLYFPYLLKTQPKKQQNPCSMKCNQNNKSNLFYWTPESIVPLQSIYISTLTPEMCILWMSSNSKNSLPWAVPMLPYDQWNKTQQEFKIQTPQMSNGLFLFIMSYKPKNYVSYLLP